MKIGIISDTHMSKHFSKLKEFLLKNLKDVDLIIHAGDYTSTEVISLLKEYTDFIGVYGNNDKSKLRSLLTDKHILTLENYRIGICHGDGPKKNTLDNVMDTFKDEKLDIIIFGHSHKACIFTKGKTMYLNPGSCTNKRKEPWFSYILLELKKDYPINATIKFF
ncbi:metallophosphoesterase family protein [Clostridium culturomicium]|uniref:metallophosphoesterase family protein n=1 Tax=Clostridium culturomicium TaxID=1499683 RepID=UPI00058B3933|nr:metallophosphoesterase family protein [Clostridium culturomicium]